MTGAQVARPCPSRSIARTRHIRGMSTLSADIILYQSCCTAASGGGVSTWTAASSCARGLAQPGLLGGRLPDASPPAAVNRLRCPAGKLLSGLWEGTAQVEARRHQHTPQGAPCPVSTAELLKVTLVFFVQATAAPGRQP